MEPHLLDKYWNAETSREEEARLMQELEGTSSPEATYFAMLAEARRQQSRLTLDDIRASNQLRDALSSGPAIRPLVRWIASAAAILVFVLSGIGLWKYTEHTYQSSLVAETYDDPYAAYEEMREALAYVSGKLNKSQSEAFLNIKKARTYSEIFK